MLLLLATLCLQPIDIDTCDELLLSMMDAVENKVITMEEATRIHESCKSYSFKFPNSYAVNIRTFEFG